MLVELGNPSAKNVTHTDPCVTYVNVPDSRTFNPNVDLTELKQSLADALVTNQGITHRPEDEALLDFVHPTSGLWAEHANAKPSWIACDKPEFASVLAAWYGCPVGAPPDVEATHWTNAGPPA